MVVIGSFSWPGIGSILGFVVGGSGVSVSVALWSGVSGPGVVWPGEPEPEGSGGAGPTGTVVSGAWLEL